MLSFLLRLTTLLLLTTVPFSERVWAANEGVQDRRVGAISRLSFQAPASCPSRTKLEERVQELLEDPLEDYSPPPIDIRINEGESPAFVVEIRVTLGTGEGIRDFGANTCPEVVEATALVVAFLLNPDLELAADSSPPVGVLPLLKSSAAPGEQPAALQNQEATASDVAPASRAVTESREAAPRERIPAASESLLVNEGADKEKQAPPELRKTDWGVFFGAIGLVDLGTLGSVAPGVAAEGGLVLNNAWSAQMGASYLPTQSVTTDGLSAEFWLLAGSLRLCRRALVLPAVFSFCGGIEAGALHGIALEEVPRPKFEPWLAPFVGFDTALPLGGEASNWAAFARADGLFPAIRDEFQVQDHTVHQPSIIVLRLGVGVRVHFL